MGPFQVIEEQEGIEADILRRLARHGRSLGQIPTADPPRPAGGLPKGGGPRGRTARALPHGPAAGGHHPPGMGPPGGQRRQLRLRPQKTPSLCPAGRGGSCGWPSSGSWSPSRARWWTGRSSPGCWTTAPPPSPPWRWREPSSCWASRRTSSPSPASRHSRKLYPPIDKPSFLVYNHGTPTLR